MIDIKETLKVPSAALQAMVDGLREQSKSKYFRITMATFGHSDGHFCFGCAATCTIQQIAGKHFEASDLINNNDMDSSVFQRANALNFDVEQLRDFEDAIDSARKGRISRLFFFFGVPITRDSAKYHHRFHLGTDDWKSELPKVEELIAELRENNL